MTSQNHLTIGDDASRPPWQQLRSHDNDLTAHVTFQRAECVPNRPLQISIRCEHRLSSFEQHTTRNTQHTTWRHQ